MNITLLTTQTTVVPAVDAITTPAGGKQQSVMRTATTAHTAFVSTFFRPDTENENWAFECVDAQFISTSIVSGVVSGDVRFYAESPQNASVTSHKQKSWKDQLTLGSSETTAPMIEFWS